MKKLYGARNKNEKSQTIFLGVYLKLSISQNIIIVKCILNGHHIVMKDFVEINKDNKIDA